MKPYGNPSGAKPGMGVQNPGHPSVKNMAPGPQSKQIATKASSKMPPSKGSWAHSTQTGSTSPMTDKGGGMGNDCSANHKRFIGK